MKIVTFPTHIEGVNRTKVIAFDESHPCLVIGECCVRLPDRDFSIITDLFVCEKWRRTGVGSAILDMAEQTALTNECKTTSLTVSLPNLRDLGPFYEKRGYRAVYQFTDGDVLFSKCLPRPATKGSMKFAVFFGGGLGPDVWDKEIEVTAADFDDACIQGRIKAEDAGGYVFSITQLD